MRKNIYGGEFHKIVKDTLAKYSTDNQNQGINMTSEAAQDLVAEAIERSIKEKFHIFRINKLYTQD
ncbi:MAG: hypothetical protein CMI54_07310 [Parcubacteria group bacterium]|nr:hypothetical protein [Parcubacteria group bacterium]|tara:strand:- start:3615 stop:3812 length:198 start_codon:yes stop_codon:yes gene_type:complete